MELLNEAMNKISKSFSSEWIGMMKVDEVCGKCPDARKRGKNELPIFFIHSL
jgi:hypothetical protein